MRKIEFFGEGRVLRAAAVGFFVGSLALAGCGSKSGGGGSSKPAITPDFTLAVNCDTGPKTATLDFGKRNVKVLQNILIEDTKATDGSSEEVQLQDFSASDVRLGLGGANSVTGYMDGKPILLGMIPTYDFVVTFGVGSNPGLTAKCS